MKTPRNNEKFNKIYDEQCKPSNKNGRFTKKIRLLTLTSLLDEKKTSFKF